MSEQVNSDIQLMVVELDGLTDTMGITGKNKGNFAVSPTSYTITMGNKTLDRDYDANTVTLTAVKHKKPQSIKYGVWGANTNSIKELAGIKGGLMDAIKIAKPHSISQGMELVN